MCDDSYGCDSNSECVSGNCVSGTCQALLSCTSATQPGNNPPGCDQSLDCGFAYYCDCNEECGGGRVCGATGVCVSCSYGPPDENPSVCDPNLDCPDGYQRPYCNAECASGLMLPNAPSSGTYWCQSCAFNTNNCQSALDCGYRNSCDCDAECQSDHCLYNPGESVSQCRNSCGDSPPKNSAWCGDNVIDPGTYCYGDNLMCDNDKGCDSNSECVSNNCYNGVCKDHFYCGPWTNCDELCTSYGYPSGTYTAGNCYCNGPAPSSTGCPFSGADCRCYSSCCKMTSTACTGSAVTEFARCTTSTGAWTTDWTPSGTYEVQVYDDFGCTGFACNSKPTCSSNPLGCNDGSTPDLATMAQADKCGEGQTADCQAECQQLSAWPYIGLKYDSSTGKCVQCLTDSDCPDSCSSSGTDAHNKPLSGITVDWYCNQVKQCAWAPNACDPWTPGGSPSCNPSGYYCDDKGDWAYFPESDHFISCCTTMSKEGALWGSCVDYDSNPSTGYPLGPSISGQGYSCVDTRPHTGAFYAVNELGQQVSDFMAIGKPYRIRAQILDDNGDLNNPAAGVWVVILDAAGVCRLGSDCNYPDDSTKMSIANDMCTCTKTWQGKCTVAQCLSTFQTTPTASWSTPVTIKAYAYDGGAGS
ncbi:hypothetical protein HYY73_03005 [Candidatus Woesearchaeota archaeon]|nr:hypothetical protein [Candidatus Woesearchaeota archaeon]